MRALSGYTWGADKQAFIDIYRALMRSAIDYGCFVYGAAAKTHLNKIDRIQSKALRLSIGAMRSMPSNAV